MSVLLSNPDSYYPLQGERFRFVYRLEGTDTIRSTWPNAVALQVDQSSYFGARGADWVASRKTEVVDVEVLALPTTFAAPTVEQMVSAIRQFSMSRYTNANLTAIYVISADEVNSASRVADAQKVLTTSWGGPAPELEEDPALPGVWDIIEESFGELFGVVGEGASDLVSPVVGRVLSPTTAVIVVGVAVVALVYAFKGR